MKCDDYVIIRLRYYADASVLNKHYKKPDSEKLQLPKQHYTRAEAHNAFFWSFIERVTGKDDKFWYVEFYFDAWDCVKDEIQETHGILISEGEGWNTYFIPKKHIDIIGWFVANINVPARIIRKSNLGKFRWRGLEVTNERREKSRERGRAFKEKFKIKQE